jgi:hypothetical protein
MRNKHSNDVYNAMLGAAFAVTGLPDLHLVATSFGPVFDGIFLKEDPIETYYIFINPLHCQPLIPQSKMTGR